MRLIDSEILKKCLEKERSYGGVKTDEFDKGYDLGVETAIEMLDNAPTVECTWIISGKRYGKKEEALKYLRPHGEWKLIKDKNKNINAECPFCKFAIEGIAYNYEIWEIQQFIKNGDFEFEFPNFCEHCGAKMDNKEAGE